MSSFSLSLAPLTAYIMENPGLRFAQGGLILLAALVLFLLFFALRDILLRTRSFWYQFVCIVIVTLFPVIGFLIYLLIRPARTIKERELEAMILTLVATEAPFQIEVGEKVREENGDDDKETKEDEEEDDDDDDDDEDDLITTAEDEEDDDDEETDDKKKEEHHHADSHSHHGL